MYWRDIRESDVVSSVPSSRGRRQYLVNNDEPVWWSRRADFHSYVEQHEALAFLAARDITFPREEREHAAAVYRSLVPILVQPGETVRIQLPSSGVCMHMRVAGEVRPATAHANGTAQILDEWEAPFSFPVLWGEAGFAHDHLGRIWYHAPCPQ